MFLKLNLFFSRLQSVMKTGRLIVAHEAPLTNGFGSEIAATVQVKQLFSNAINNFFLCLQSPQQ